MKHLAIVAALVSSPAAASTYCHVPMGFPEDAFVIFVTDNCKQGDLVVIAGNQPEYVARACDLTKPVIPTGQFVVCSLGSSIRERRTQRSSHGFRAGYPAIAIPAP